MSPGDAAARWIARLRLEPHPEGGFFRRIHTDSRQVDTAGGRRAAVTSIYYLLSAGAARARLHRNQSPILHYLLDGGPVDYAWLSPAGELSQAQLRRDQGDALFLYVPGSHWKASALAAGAAFALIAEAVVPGFDYADHEFMSEARLASLDPLLRQRLAPFLNGPGASIP